MVALLISVFLLGLGIGVFIICCLKVGDRDEEIYEDEDEE